MEIKHSTIETSHQTNGNASEALENFAAMNVTLRQELEIMKQAITDNECSVCFEPVCSFHLTVTVQSCLIIYLVHSFCTV